MFRPFRFWRTKSGSARDPPHGDETDSVSIGHEDTPSIIRTLSGIVERNTERLISGEVRLSLTPASLLVVNTAFNKYQAEMRLQQDGMSLTSHESGTSGLNGFLSRSRSGPSSPDSENIEFRADNFLVTALKSDIKLLDEFLSQTKSLIIVHGHGTILGRIRLAPLFTSLAVLELKRVPIHLVCGISQLRGTLKSLSVIRSLSSLEEIFVKCGGDMSEPQSWPHLRTVNLSCNGIEQLDSSLRLLPKLETLDLSHNLLISTEHFLEYLPDLLTLNLSYNKLDSFPSLSYSARQHLSILALRGNNLDHLKGLELLTDLKEFDCRDNCIHEMRILEPLAQLHILQAVAFIGNPIAFIKDYRSVALQFVSRRAALESRTMFDGSEITKRETAFLPLHPPRLLTNEGHDESAENDMTLSLPIDGTRSGRTPLRRRMRKSDKRRKVRSAREAIITDSDTLKTDYETDGDRWTGGSQGAEGEEEPSATEQTRKPSSYQDTEVDISEIKAKVEELRLSRGQDWLQEWPAHIQADSCININHVQKRVTEPEVNSGEDIPGPELSEQRATCGSVEKDIRDVEELTTTSSSGVPWTECLADESDSDVFVKGDVKEPEDDLEVLDDLRIFDVSDNKQVKEEEVIMPVTAAPSKDYGVEMNSFIVANSQFKRSDCPFCSASYKEPIDEDGTDSDRVDILRFLSLTSKYIVERDLEGDVTYEMDMSCLEKIEEMEAERPWEDEESKQCSDLSCVHPSFSLHFSYCAKNRKLRRYWIENQKLVDEMSRFMKPFIDHNQKKKTSTAIYKCLRCSHEFQKQTQLWERRRQYHDMDGSNASPPPPCPECLTPLVVELEASSDGVEAAAEPQLQNGTSGGAVWRVVERDRVGETNGTEVAEVTWLDNRVGDVKTSIVEAGEKQGTKNQIETNAADLRIENLPSGSRELVATSSDSSIAILTPRPEVSETQVDVSHLEDAGFFCANIPNSRGISFFLEPNPSTEGNENPSSNETKWTSSSGSIAVEEDPTTSKHYESGSTAAANAVNSPHQSVDSSQLQTPSGSFIDNFSTAASLTKSVFQNMAASVIASSIGGSPANSTGKVELRNAHAANPASPIKPSQTDNQPQNRPSPSSPANQVKKFSKSDSYAFSFDDYSIVDHRLSLYASLILFGDEEECVSVLRADVIQNGKAKWSEDEELDVYKLIPALVVTSTTRIYILRITSLTLQGQPDDWLELLDEQFITSLAYIDWGLGSMSFRLEFSTASACYCVIIRDEQRCVRYVRGLIEQVKKSVSSPLSKLKSISKHQNPVAFENLMRQIGNSANEEEDRKGPVRGDEDSPPSPSSAALESPDLRSTPSYSLAFDISSSTEFSAFTPVTLVVNDGHFFILKENFHHPFPHDLPPPPPDVSSIPQFSIIQRNSITEISCICLMTSIYDEEVPSSRSPVFRPDMSGARFVFFDQTATSLRLGFETPDARHAFVKILAHFWQEDFGVELEIVG